MRVKRKDFELLVDYITKEKPEYINIKFDDQTDNVMMSFTFKDVENRDCNIQLYEAYLNVTPDLIKSMKLYARTEKK